MTFATGATRLIFLGLLLMATRAEAKSVDEAGITLSADATAAEFQTQRAAINEALAEPELYSEMDANTRKSLQGSLDAMAAQLEAKGSLSAMDESERSALETEADRVNKMLETARNESRLVCTRETTMGSNRARRVCMTVAQRRRQSGTVQPTRED
ncbi:hypothetical protein [Arenimonas alkanexedens]